MLETTEISPGVQRHVEGRKAVYAGKADALISAGLVTLEQLPGQPGNGRGMCTYDADGSKVRQGRARSASAGRKYIVAKLCAAGRVFEVSVVLSPERIEALEAQRVRACSAWPFPVVVGERPQRQIQAISFEAGGQ